MDLHILIVIACVFLASLCSLLFINKFLRRKTFEEIVAEKKALTEKIYGKDRASFKKPKKQALKKELKREKKQRQREQVTTTEQEDSDVHSEQAEDEPQGLSKIHVEFEPDPEIVTYNQTISRPSSNAEKENINKHNKSKKDKKLGTKSGILIHKNDQNIVKETATIEVSTLPSNNFDIKIPKDAVELKKAEKKDEKSLNKKDKNFKKSDNRQIFDKSANVENNLEAVVEVVAAPVVIKEVKQLDEKVRQSSPKNNQQKGKQQNKKQKDLKDAVVSIEKLSESDTVGVSLLMNLFRRAELNRSEIQILIDYLLNRQQDMPSTHSEWSDDICQKLKRQLEDKEKALSEEQEASIGIQAKLRELRSEINTERAAMSNTIKSYVEKIQTKDQDIALLEQKIKTLNDNLSLERQQFQAKLIHEKQSGTQDLLAQLQMMQNEIAHKDKCIAELTCIVNASRQAVEESQQKNEIIQNQAQQLRTLEQQRDELEQVSNNRIFELEKAKQLESEFNDSQVEIRNLQNDLESLQNEMSLIRTKSIKEKHQEFAALQTKNAELTQQLLNITNQTQEQTKEHSNLQTTIEALITQLSDKEKHLLETQNINSQIQQQLSLVESASKQQSAENDELQKIIEGLEHDVSSKTQLLQSSELQAENQQELQKLIKALNADVQKKEQQLNDGAKQLKQQEELLKLIDSLKADVFNKDQQLKDVEKETEKLINRENELFRQLQEQKEKNNDLRTKNWKLVEALQNAEAKVSKQSPTEILVQQERMFGVSAKPALGDITEAGNDHKHMRDLLQRLCPEAVKACAGISISVSFIQWLEQVLTTHFKQQQVSSSHKSTQSNSLQSASAPQQNSHSNLNSANGSRSSSSSASNSPGGETTGLNNSENHELLKENSILRIRIEELTKLARKTETTLSDLMKQAEEQDEHWRNIMQSKDEQIKALQHSNGQGDI